MNRFNLPTVVFSRPRNSSSFFSDEERSKSLLERLSERFPRLNIFFVPCWVDLDPDGEIVRRLRETTGNLLVLSPFSERTTRGFFDFVDIQEKSSDSESQTEPNRRIVYRTYSVVSEESFSQTIEAFCQATDFSKIDASTANGDRTSAFFQEPTLTERWFPIIDRDACLNCLECVNFCLFGVYSVDRDNRPFVERPSACRDGCPACSRVCPGGAIIFPFYNDPAINGTLSTDDVREQMKNFASNDESSVLPNLTRGDLAGLLPENLSVEERREIERKANEFKRKSDSSSISLEKIVDATDDLPF